ncbi:RING/FYVE/PHD zinc finger superfamily protein [Striga hermonthica]|uniref:RING/FYVE/PHD zinc finger superfamily protein n=1 Tax=Striga hermonthica TaxID=68872 RepID=A0A9N7NI96_STRHE|nr:RING/FYVE/PHD zinc finger superfamily protein [Striga hermonthica]
MSTLEITHIDLEIGRRSSVVAAAAEEEEEEVESVCFSDGSSNSQFYSTIDGDGSYDDCSFVCGSEILEAGAVVSRKASSVADTCESVDLEYGEKKENMEDLERDCRICHLSLISSSPGSGVPIELGCSCKDDLAAAHKHCAEAWFKIKGNKTCEICNSIARNVVGPTDTETLQQQSGERIIAVVSDNNTLVGPTMLTAQNRTCLNGHRFLNFLLACMVFAFVISWLFHFNIPS